MSMGFTDLIPLPSSTSSYEIWDHRVHVPLPGSDRETLECFIGTCVRMSGEKGREEDSMDLKLSDLIYHQ